MPGAIDSAFPVPRLERISHLGWLMNGRPEIGCREALRVALEADRVDSIPSNALAIEESR